MVSGNIVPWAPTARVYPVDAPVDTPPIVLLPGFGNCSADYENPYGDPNGSMAAVLRVGHQDPMHQAESGSCGPCIHMSLGVVCSTVVQRQAWHRWKGHPAHSAITLLCCQRRGFKVYVVQMERKDWLKVGRAMISRNYWAGLCTVDPGYR